MTKCNRCGQEIVWSEKYDPNATKRSPPNNKDGTPHRCSSKTETLGNESHQESFQVQDNPKGNPVSLADIDLPHDTKQKICNTCKKHQQGYTGHRMASMGESRV